MPDGPARDFRHADQWRALFEARGLTVVATRWLGGALERLVHHPLLFALDIGRAGFIPGPAKVGGVGAMSGPPTKWRILVADDEPEIVAG